MRPNICHWKLDPDEEGWFILYAELNEGQISYHLPVKYLSLVGTLIGEDKNIKWDNHTSDDVVKRLEAEASFKAKHTAEHVVVRSEDIGSRKKW